MINDKISIIVPCYNVEHYVENSVKSIRQQTYRNIEIILIDDGSSDGTPQILDKIAKTDSRVMVIHKENGGVTSARLAGIKKASGEWIGFVDGDDYIEQEMFEMMVNNAHHYKADISHCGYQMVFPSRVDYYYNTGRIVEQDTFAGIKDLLEGVYIEPGLWNKLFHKSLFHRLLEDNIMDESIKINEDLLMNYYLFRESRKSVFEDKCYYHYVVREGSASISKLNESKLADPLLVQKIIKEETKKQEQLQRIVDNRIVSLLISLSTLRLGKQRKIIYPYRKSARVELRKMLPMILKGPYSKKKRMMSVWASILPLSYKLIDRKSVV